MVGYYTLGKNNGNRSYLLDLCGKILYNNKNFTQKIHAGGNINGRDRVEGLYG